MITIFAYTGFGLGCELVAELSFNNAVDAGFCACGLRKAKNISHVRCEDLHNMQVTSWHKMDENDDTFKITMLKGDDAEKHLFG